MEVRKRIEKEQEGLGIQGGKRASRSWWKIKDVRNFQKRESDPEVVEIPLIVLWVSLRRSSSLGFLI